MCAAAPRLPASRTVSAGTDSARSVRLRRRCLRGLGHGEQPQESLGGFRSPSSSIAPPSTERPCHRTAANVSGSLVIRASGCSAAPLTMSRLAPATLARKWSSSSTISISERYPSASDRSNTVLSAIIIASAPSGVSVSGKGARLPQRPSERTTASSSLPHSVSSYTREPAGGGSFERRTTPTCSSSRRRCDRTSALRWGRPARRSVKRLGPSSSSRTTSSAQRSPIRSSALATPHGSP